MPNFIKHILRRRVLIPAAVVAVLAAGGATAGVALASGSGSFPTPAGAHVITVTDTTATLGWMPVSGAQAYGVKVFNQDGSTQIASLSTSATDINVTGLTAGTEYEWQVFTGGEAGVATPSAPTPLMPVFTAAAAGPAGPAGPAGAAGPAGPAGAQGPSGVTAVKTADLGGLAKANSGGSFYAGGSATEGAQEVGSGVAVAAGTYEVCLNAKATPEAAPATGTDTGISAQFFLYNQAKNAAFTGDLLNASTPLQPDGTNHDSYASGCTLITVPSGGQTLEVLAFGYQTDDGSGNYAVDDVSLSLVAVTPA